jgi:hypothetical protein
MKCSECREELVGYAEDVLDLQVRQQVAAHLQSCAACCAEADQQEELRNRLLRDAANAQETPLELPVMSRIMREQTFKLRRRVMRKRYGQVGIGLAAAAAVAAVLFLPLWSGSASSQATAAEVFAQAAEVLSDLRAVYIRLNVRAHERDNFESISLANDFVEHEMWKKFGHTPQWRVEKPGRVVVMNGESSLLWIQGPGPGAAAKGAVDAGFVVWLLPLLDVDRVLDSELSMTGRIECSELCMERDAEGGGKLIVTIEAKAQGDFTNDWLKNKSISESDHRRIYTFDAATKRLEDLEVWVHGPDGDVLVAETEQIVYDPPIDPDLFTLDLPEDVIWVEETEILDDNQTYAQMSPDEVARAFFQACADRDWKEVLKFWNRSELEEEFKDGLGGLEIISIGEPFQSGQFGGWFVPYEVSLKNGMTLKHNLALRNDNRAGRYVVDGGL